MLVHRTAATALVIALFSLALGEARAQSVRRAILVGVSDYQTVNDLRYCDDDAQALRTGLLNDPRWQTSNITLLVDQQATKAAIQSAISGLAAVADNDDICVIFFSGHGTNGPDIAPIDEADNLDEYICPYDTVLGNYSHDIRDDELSDWVGAIHAGSLTVILDTCYSGGQVKALSKDVGGGIGFRTINLGGTVSKKGDGFARDLVGPVAMRDLNDLTSIVVLTACDDNELSAESIALGHGFFTYYLLEAMSSPLTDTNGDGELSAEELFAYVRPRATSFYDIYRSQPRQHAQVYDSAAGETNILRAVPPAPTSVFASVSMNSDPLWTTQGQWAWGQPTGGGGAWGGPDPSSGCTGTTVYGYNLVGDYANSLSTTNLTSAPFDCTGWLGVQLRFRRWLGVESSSYDKARLQVSNDSSTWTELWGNPNIPLSDAEWILCQYPLGSLADNASTVYLRWVMGPTDSSYVFCGWNIDDVQLLGYPVGTAPTVSSIDPNVGMKNTTVHVSSLAGSNFQAGTAVRITKLGQPNINAQNVTVVSGGAITCDFDLTGVSAGEWSVEVINPDAQIGRLPSGFQVIGVIYYVNDSSTTNDDWCTAPGDDSNSGILPSTPKATVQAVLDTYDLEPGDVVRIDTGTYNLASNIVVGSGDGGSSAAPVTFQGSPYGVTFNRGSTGSSSYGWQIDAGYVTLTTATSSKYPGVAQSLMKVTGGNYGVRAGGSNCLVSRLNASGNSNIGVYVSTAGIVANCLATGDGRGVYCGASSVTVRNCTISGSGAYGVDCSGYGGTTLSNNIIVADGAGRYGIYGTSGTSDYNLIYATNGAYVGYSGGNRAALADWQAATGKDTHGLSRDPLFVDAINGDYHLQSTAGSYHGGAWTADGANSPGIDTGSGDAGTEPAPNSTPLQGSGLGQRNLGAYGGTEQGSMTPATRQLYLYEPVGAEYYLNQATPVSIRWTWVGRAWQIGDTIKLRNSVDSGSTWTDIPGAAAVPLINQTLAGCLRFARTTDTVHVTGQTDLNSNCTFEARVYFPSGDAAEGVIFNEWTSGYEDKLLAAGPSRILGCTYPSSAPSSAVSITTNTWHHVAYVHDASANVKRMYLDGVQVGSFSGAGNIGNSSGQAFIGAIYRDGQISPGMIGYMETIRISGIARYSGASFSPPIGDLASDSDTLLLYDFDEGDFYEDAGLLKIRDLSPLARDGTLGSGFAGATAPTRSDPPPAGTFIWDISVATSSPLCRVSITSNQGSPPATDQSGRDFRTRSTMVYYVNDSSTTNDEWCTAPGDDSNSGILPSTPKATVQAVLDTYDLEPGDVVRIDTGTYNLASNIVVGSGDGGSSAAPVAFQGSPYGVTFNRGSTGSSSYGWQIDAGYVTLTTATSSKYPGVAQSLMKVTGGNYGVRAGGSNCLVSRLNASGNSNIGVYVSTAGIVANCLATGDGRGVYCGASSVTVRNCTISGSGAYGVDCSGYGGTTLSNNIIVADGAGRYGIYGTPGTSDYNLIYATNGAYVGYSGGNRAALADWQAATGKDAQSISSDPRFRSAQAFDWHLLSDSPCANAGNPNFTPASSETDMDGQPRVMYGRVDIGADELTWVGDIDGDGHVDVADLLVLASSWAKTTGQPGFNTVCDLNSDGSVNVIDLLYLADNWGK